MLILPELRFANYAFYDLRFVLNKLLCSSWIVKNRAA